MATGAVVARILTQYSDKGSKQAQKDIKKLGKDIDAFGKKAKKSFGIAIAATAALSLKIGTDAVKAAIDDSKSQAILASAMVNTNNATREAIAAAENYIKVTQFRVNVTDSELRASLATLFIATKDLTEAERLQTIALDVAAATGRDLQTVTIGIVKAQQGNVESLKRLSPEISGLITKTTKAEDIIGLLGTTYAGTAAQLAKLDPLTTLKLAYGEILETVGIQLIPVVTKFADYVVQKVIPAFENWAKASGPGLTDSLQKVFMLSLEVLSVIMYLVGLFQRFTLATESLGKALLIAFTVSRLLFFALHIIKIVDAFKALRAAAGAAAVMTALATGGTSVGLAVAALAAAGLGIAGMVALGNLSEGMDKATDETSKLTEETLKTGDAFKLNGAVLAKLEKDKAAAAAKAAAANKKAAKDAAIEAKNIELKNRLVKKYGLQLTDKDEYDNIQLTAVEMLQKKQKDADAALLERIKARKEEVLLFEAMNKNAERYSDLLTVLADQVISSDEIAILAKKWGMSTDAVTSYIFTIFAIKDTVISDAEVKALADSWGMTGKQAEQYLEFLSAINSDGYLSETEITKLMNKWKLTKEEATKYADFVSKIGDGKLDDSEITKLKSTWGLTNQQVVDYIVKIGGKVDASGTILSAGDIAALGWTNALTALQKYLNELAKGTGGAGPTGTGTGSFAASVAKVDAIAQGIVGTVQSMSPELIASKYISAAQAEQYLADQAITREGLGPKYAGMLKGLVGMASGGIVTSPTQALIGEAGAEAVIPLNRIGSVLSSLTNSDGIGSSRSNNTNITVNVAGSVTSQNDLVAAIRQGLLRGQTNGQTLTLQAI